MPTPAARSPNGWSRISPPTPASSPTTLLSVRDHIRDLLDVFRDGFVYDRAMEGSFSIKKVLPALFPDDPNLDYHSLMDVHNGTEATDTYLSFRGKEKEERLRLRESLLKYCGLDTLAMTLLWQRLREFCACEAV